MNSENESQTCRWGILSTATIGQKNWQAINLSGNGKLVAVASRNASSCAKFIAQCQAAVPFKQPPRVIEGYEQLLTADDIDAVYIPLPTGLRKQWVIRAAESGKHVLCEKPCASSLSDLQEMVDACKRNNVQFMDGIMYMHSRRLQQVRTALDSRIGEIRRIATQFSFFGDQEFGNANIRTNSQLEPFGCLGDLGWYTIRFALWALNYKMPTRVYGRMLNSYQRDDSPNAVPMEIECGLHFDNGVTATFYNSFITGHQQWAHVSGTKGSVFIPDFVLPYSSDQTRFSIVNSEFVVKDCKFSMIENRDEVEIAEPGDSDVNSQETNLFRNFGNIVVEGKLDHHWPEIALLTQRVMDACYDSATNDGKSIELS